MYSISAVGYIALVVTALGYLPQVVKTVKTRSTKDISLGSFAALFFGAILWLVYAVYINDRPLIAAHVVTAILTGTILFVKIRTRK